MIAYLDCSSGVSGDKFLGALLDAGFDPSDLADALAGLDVGDFEIGIGRAVSGGIAATRVTVSTGPEEAESHRTWRDIRRMLETAALPAGARDRALAVFELLAEAEGRVHAVAADDVHFHEVGAVDSIVDIVGVAVGLGALGIDELWCSPVPTGHGTVITRHGPLPVPAPATALLLRGVPAYGGGIEAELTTPTGAALVAALATGFGPMPLMRISAVGHGAGTLDLPIPNVLRIFAGERGDAATERSGAASGQVVTLETNVDHLAPELLALALERMLDAGALDAWQTPIVMKKGRAAIAVSVMCDPADEARMAELLIAETGTLGVRRTLSSRWTASRQTLELETSLGMATFKVAELPDGRRTLRPEIDDVARIARETGRPVADVARRLGREAQAVLGDEW
jgi:pyridinium-3,5-bisthiocarboxylic acid mononucleotide nickel chelatase